MSPSSSDSPLHRLREIRDLRAAADALIPERDQLVRQAIEEGSTERVVAGAAGLSHQRVHQIMLGK